MPPDYLSLAVLHVEDEFRLIVNRCGTNFDFTLLFEESVLFVLPLSQSQCMFCEPADGWDQHRKGRARLAILLVPRTLSWQLELEAASSSLV